MKAWEPPLAYTGVVTGYMVEQALYCEYRPLHIAAEERRRITPGRARLLTRQLLATLGSTGEGWTRLRIAGEALGVPVIVSPDAAYVVSGRIRGLVRSRIRRGLRAREQDWAPLYLAGLVLEETHGSLIDGGLTLVLLLAESSERLAQGLAHLRKTGPKPLAGEGWRATTRIYTREEAYRLLRRPLDVIRGASTPRQPPGTACKYCRYRSSCPWAGGGSV